MIKMDQDPTIDKLKKESEGYKAALQSEVKGWVEESKNIALKIVLIGGGLALAYLISKQLLGKKKKNGEKSYSEGNGSSVLSDISSFILREVSVFLLAIAKERLLKYLEESNRDEEINSSNSQ